LGKNERNPADRSAGELEKVMSFGFVFVFRHPMMQLAKSRTWPDIWPN